MRKYSTLLVCIILSNLSVAQSNSSKAVEFPNFNQHVYLEELADTTANASMADFDGDGHLDILLIKGRHWPIVDRVLLGDGKGGIRMAYDLGTVADRSYTGGLADFNGDGFVDIAISNDSPDKKLIFLNDGTGKFTIGSEFGLPEWPTRNLAIADINNDKLPDLILANRGRGSMSNFICINQGNGKFEGGCFPVAPYPATTITPTDINADKIIDLVIPHRNGGQSYVYLGNSAFRFSDANRIPFGPPDATIRGAAVADYNDDGLLDIVTIDERKGVQLYVGKKDKTFSNGVSLSDAKAVPYAIALADLNNDNKPDILIGHIRALSVVYFNKGGESGFERVFFGDSEGSVYGFATGDFNEDGNIDIVAARSGGRNVVYLGNFKSKE